VPVPDLQRVSSRMLKLQPRRVRPRRSRFWLRARRGKIAGKIFCLTRILPLFFDARSQSDLIRIIRSRCATRQDEPAEDYKEKQYGPHVRDHAIRQPRTSITNPPRSTRCRLQIRSRILHNGTVQPTPFNTRSPLVLTHVAIRLPTTPAPAQHHQAEEGDEHKGRTTVSIRGFEFGGGHWVEALSTTVHRRECDFGTLATRLIPET
jgi:hypothetical protein